MMTPTTSRHCEINSRFDELVYWKNLALDYKSKYEHLLAKRTRQHVLQSHEDNPPLKMKKTEEILKDPVEFDLTLLPSRCHQNIFKYFKGKELLRLTEVSASWKVMIESDKILTRKIQDNVKLTLKNAVTRKDQLTLILNKRQYKHLELIDCFEEKDSIIQHLAANLESLSIKDSFDFERKLPFGFKFPKLRKLTVSHYGPSWLVWLQKCKFPALIEFRYEHKYSNNSSMQIFGEEYIEMLQLMPKLKRLSFQALDYEYLEKFPPDFKLEAVNFEETIPLEFCENMQSTLKSLRGRASFSNVYDLLSIMDEIETLSVSLVKDDEEDEDEDNEEETIDLSLEHGNLTNLIIDTYSDYEFRQIIEALPELRTLICYKFMRRHDVEFLAHNAYNLRKLICRGGIENFLLDFYEDLQSTGDEDWNTNFEICIEDEMSWEEDGCIWEEKAFLK